MNKREKQISHSVSVTVSALTSLHPCSLHFKRVTALSWWGERTKANSVPPFQMEKSPFSQPATRSRRSGCQARDVTLEVGFFGKARSRRGSPWTGIFRARYLDLGVARMKQVHNDTYQFIVDCKRSSTFLVKRGHGEQGILVVPRYIDLDRSRIRRLYTVVKIQRHGAWKRISG